MTAAITRIGAEDAALGVHLERSVRTGRFCIYDPEPGTAPGGSCEFRFHRDTPPNWLRTSRPRLRVHAFG